MGDERDYDDDSLEDIKATRSRGRSVRVVTSREEYDADVQGLVAVPPGSGGVTIRSQRLSAAGFVAKVPTSEP